MKKPILNSVFKSLNLSSDNCRLRSPILCRLCSTQTRTEFKEYQNNLFNKEAKQQLQNVGRIEKIAVTYEGHPRNMKLVMNKKISTPYNCAQHMAEMLVRRSALALIDGVNYWDMHRPLENDCTLNLLHFQDENPTFVNKAFWRTCSFMLGCVVSKAFKDQFEIKLHSFPRPDVRSGSFVYDVEIPNLPDWNPNTDELRVLSAEMVKLSHSSFPVERLSVSEDLALQIFQINEYKSKQIPDMAASSAADKKVVLYRIGDHIDISRGPMVANTWFLGRCTIAAVYRLEKENSNFYRFQGIALPKGIMLNHFAYSVLEKRAQKLNKGLLPWQHEDTFDSELQTVEASV